MEAFLYAVALAALASGFAAIGYFFRRPLERRRQLTQIQWHREVHQLLVEMRASGATIADLTRFNAKIQSNELDDTDGFAPSVPSRATFEIQGLTTLEMVNDIQSKLAAANERVDRTLAQLKLYLHEGPRAALDIEQAAFNAYAKQSAEFEGARYEGGTIRPIVMLGKIYGLTLQRAEDLEQELASTRDERAPSQD